MAEADKIIQILRTRGPCLPAMVAKDLGSNILLASAMLSEVSSRKKVLVSKLKVGSSPIYYLAEHKTRLMQWADNLNEKDLRTYEFLKESKVLRESECEPLTRVSLKNIPDFAIPLHVTIDENKELFYKWYLLSNEEASLYISKLFETQTQPAVQPDTTQQPAPAAPAQDLAQEKPAPPPVPEEENEPIISDTPEEVSQELSESSSESFQDQSPSISASITTPPAASVTFSASIEPELPPTQTTPEPAEKETPTPTVDPAFKEEQTHLPLQEEPAVSLEEEPIKEELPLDDPLFSSIQNFFEEKSIEVSTCKVIRKGREINLIIVVPSVVGRLRYFAKILHKKKVNDKDVSAAFLEGDMQKLPLLFLYTGDLTKKAKEMSANPHYRNLMIQQVEFDGR